MCGRLSHFMNSTHVAWFKSYLDWRELATKYCNSISKNRRLTTGVSEGSVLGPTLFSMYINSLLNILEPDTAIAYADDVTIISFGKTPAIAAANAEMVFSSVYIWSEQNGLILNPAKCFCMYITATRNNKHQDGRDLALGSNGARIKLVDELKILGVSISSDLQWTVQARQKSPVDNQNAGFTESLWLLFEHRHSAPCLQCLFHAQCCLLFACMVPC